MDYLLELKLHILGARKAATDIKQIHVETNLSLELRKRSQSNSQIHHASALPPTSHLGFRYTHPHVEDTAGIRDGLHEGLRICTAASHVETRNKKGESTIPKKNYLQWGGGGCQTVSPKYHHLSLSTVSPDTNDVDVQLSGPFQKQPAGFECGTKFNTEATDCLGIIGGNPQNQPRSKKRAANLHDIRITYGHGQNTKRTFGSDDDTLCFKPKMVTSV